MHIHLDPIGGIAGDMFVAALLDAWPALAEQLPPLLAQAGLPASITVQTGVQRDHGLQGTRFQVRNAAVAHPHVAFREIRARLANSTLPPAVSRRAIDIFALLAEAEGRVHGVTAEAVTFHEVGSWDSIADIVAAAFLIEVLAVKSWSVAPLPLGSGRIRSAHGTLPVPAPATALLLEGFVVQHDGRAGERVTPTGAAILKYLAPVSQLPSQPLTLTRGGVGFGTRRFEDLPNILRLLAFEQAAAIHADEVAVLHFEIDDQPAEDLAVGLDRLRALPAVLDVTQAPVFGKQGRLTTHIQILARPEALDTVIAHCFTETTTLGLRWQIVHRATLERRLATFTDENRSIGVKVAKRPDGAVTAKAEMRDVAQSGGFAQRSRQRQTAEQKVLQQRGDDDE